MTAKVNRAGHIVMPKEMRERMGFLPGTEIEVSESPEGVLLRRRPRMVKTKDGLWVLTSKAPPGFDWEHQVEAAREERDRLIMGPFEGENEAPEPPNKKRRAAAR